MENLTKDANPILTILKSAGYTITESVRLYCNQFYFNSFHETIPIIELIKMIISLVNNISLTSNLITPEILVIKENCKSKRFILSNDLNPQDTNQRRITSQELSFLERIIKSNENVQTQKLKIIESLRKNLNISNVKDLPDCEIPTSAQNNLEEYIVQFVELNENIKTAVETFNLNRQELLEKYSLLKENNNSVTTDRLSTYHFHPVFIENVPLLKTDFRLLYDFVVGSIDPSNDCCIDVVLTKFSTRLSSLKTEVTIAKSKDHARKRVVKKFKQTLDLSTKGSLKIDQFESRIRSLPFINQKCILKNKFENLKQKVQCVHEAQHRQATKMIIKELFTKQQDCVEYTLDILQNLREGINYAYGFLQMLAHLLSIEAAKLDNEFNLAELTGRMIIHFHRSIVRQENEFRNIAKNPSKNSNDRLFEFFCKQVMLSCIHVSSDASLSEVISQVETRIQQEKNRLQKEYSYENIYRKLEPLRYSMKNQDKQIYSGPLEQPVFQHSAVNDQIQGLVSEMYGLLLRFDCAHPDEDYADFSHSSATTLASFYNHTGYSK